MNPSKQHGACWLWPWSRDYIQISLILIAAFAPMCPAPGAEPPPEIILGQPCTLELALEPGMAIAEDNGFCSFRPAGDAKPLRFKMVSGLADTNLVSFESVDRPGFFLRHFLFRLRVDAKPAPANPLFNGDATFEARPSRIGAGLRLRSFNYRDCFVAVTHTKKAYIVPDPDPEAMAIQVTYHSETQESPRKP